MQQYCYRIILPSGFVKELKKEFELFVRSPKTIENSEKMRICIAKKLYIPNENVTSVTLEEFYEVRKVNVLPPVQLTMIF